MAAQTATQTIGNQLNRTHMVVPAGMILILVVMLVPLPTMVLDFCITLNITLSIIILLLSMYIEKPISFSVFPSVLLLLTLFRLALNLASTRLILLNGRDGTSAAGQVIRAFGEFVVGGSFVVGLVAFFVLIVIQYVVINHGAVRISEVTARFTLDALPGKQMAIDADLAAGNIDDDEARKRRMEIRQEADFYGSMDGAIRFTQRDAIAAIIIVFINIIAGFIVGVMQFDMTVEESLRTYTILTIGDGLGAALPSLLVSVAGAVITTRVSAKHTLGEDVSEQLSRYSRPLYICAGILTALGLVPGMPKISFLGLGLLCLFLGKASVRKEAKLAEVERQATKQKEVRPPEDLIETSMKVDILALEIGYGLIPLVDRSQGGDLVDRIKSIRKQLAVEIGVIVPPIHISDNLKLQPREYAILIKDSIVEKGDVHPQLLMAINPGNAVGGLGGIPTSEPSYQLPALWVQKDQREQAQIQGYTVVDASTVLSTHLNEVIRRHAYELVSRQETMKFIERVSKDSPKVVEELIPNMMTVGEVQKVLQNLLKERVPIRDMVTVLETLADFARATKNPVELTEYVRQSLKRTICSTLADERGELKVFTMSPQLERIFQENIRTMNDTPVFIPDPDSARTVLEKLQNLFGKSPEMMRSVVLCSSNVRPFLRGFTEQYFPLLNILSYSEIPPHIRVVSLGMVN